MAPTFHAFGGKHPRVAPDAFVAPTAVLIGDVVVGAGSSIWFGAVLRGDNPHHGIRIGERVSIQDNCVVHVGDWGPTVVEDDVTVGHGAKFESCTIGAGTLIGMNAVLLKEVRIGRQCVVAANAVVREGMVVADRSVIAGVPATVRKHLEGSAADWVARSAHHYHALSRQYLAEGIGRVPPEPAPLVQPSREE